jgi:hypothetical protein
LLIFIKETSGRIYLQEEAICTARRSILPALCTSSFARGETALNTQRIGECVGRTDLLHIAGKRKSLPLAGNKHC